MEQGVYETDPRQRRMYWEAGCSAFAWETTDEKHLWGRNFDFNRIADGSKITYLPRGTKYYTFGTELEGTLDLDTVQTAVYAAVGTGIGIFPSTPVLYEGINEKGLMGGQLYYREFAYFSREKKQGKLCVQPPFAVTYFLTQCAGVEEVVEKLQEICLVGQPLLSSDPTIHWTFSDKTGETIVIESDREGLHIYRNTQGILTNSPSYAWHRTNLLNYVPIRNGDYEQLQLNGDCIAQCFSGSGAFGIPGDWSSPSRFVRLSYLKHYAVKGCCEEEGVAYLFRLLQSAAFPYGMVKVTDNGTITEFDTKVKPYDYTIYTAVMCAESLRFYWTTYENFTVQYVELEKLACQLEEHSFALGRKPEFSCVFPETFE